MKKIFSVISLYLLSFSASVHAALPTPTAPSSSVSATSSNVIDATSGYANMAFILLGILISGAGFLWIAWSAFAKLQEVRAKKAEWGELGLYVVSGAAVILFAIYLLNLAKDVWV